MITQQTASESQVQASLHLRDADDQCPWCEQPIPHDKFEEIKFRIESAERSRAEDAENRLRASFAAEKAKVEQKAKADLDQALDEARALAARSAQEAEEREVAARNEGRLLAEEATATLASERRDWATKLVEHTATATARETAAREEGRRAADLVASESAASERLKAAEEKAVLEAALKAADANRVALEHDRAEAIARAAELTEAASLREETARHEGRRAAEADISASVDAERARAQDEKSALQSELKAAELAKETLARERGDIAARLAETTASVVAREQAAREEGQRIAESAGATLLQAARDAHAVAELQLHELRASKEKELFDRLSEQREALEKDKTDSLNAERSQAFNDKLNLEGKLSELQRQLQNKTSAELGEGAEVDLFEMLRAEFPNDRITRVSKGVSGADIVHKVIHRGKTCGSIIYESKNCAVWRDDYATKLRKDQLAAQADHAVIATTAFPRGVRQLHIVDSVILTNPARAVAVAQILRKQLVQLYSLRVSSEAREEKTTRLYAFMTSDRCTQLLDRMSTATEGLAEIDVKEVKAHQATWKKRGELIRFVQKYQADFSLEVDRIVGTSETGRAR